MQSDAVAAVAMGDRGASPDAVAARLMVPVVCKTTDILRIFGFSERTFFQLRAARKLFADGTPIPPMTTIDASLRFSGYDVIDYVRRRGVVAADGDAQRPVAERAGRSYFQSKGRRHSHAR